MDTTSKYNVRFSHPITSTPYTIRNLSWSEAVGWIKIHGQDNLLAIEEYHNR